MAREIYVSIDVEASGPIPGEYSMLSIGACIVGNTKKKFYVELKPLNDNYVDQALKVCGLSMKKLKLEGVEPRIAIEKFTQWVGVVSKGSTPVFCSWCTFDWMFMKWYLTKFGFKKLFGPCGCDMKSYYAGMMNVEFGNARKKCIPEYLMPKKKHTHNALDDALEQAELYENMFGFNEKAHPAKE